MTSMTSLKRLLNYVKLSPSGEYFIEDLYRAGGVTGVMKRLYENGRLMLMKKNSCSKELKGELAKDAYIK